MQPTITTMWMKPELKYPTRNPYKMFFPLFKTLMFNMVTSAIRNAQLRPTLKQPKVKRKKKMNHRFLKILWLNHQKRKLTWFLDKSMAEILSQTSFTI